MTTPNCRHGRPAADLAARRFRVSFSLATAALLAIAASPALAQDAASMRDDSAELPGAGAVVRQSMTFSDRAMALASDFNRLSPANALLASAAGKGGDGEGRIKSVLHRAMALLGTPYRWGGTTPEGGFDCSGLVGYVFRNALGIELPRVSREMAKSGQSVDRHELAQGDLVFFGKSGTVDHVGIYVGEGRFLHAPRTGRDVTVSSMDTGYWAQKFMSARRVAAGS